MREAKAAIEAEAAERAAAKAADKARHAGKDDDEIHNPLATPISSTGPGHWGG